MLGKYDHFGDIEASKGTSDNKFNFTGKESDDESGLIYFGARYYNPLIGRWMSRDPKAGFISKPQGLNKYQYCQNNPFRFFDPDGKEIQLVATSKVFKVIPGAHHVYLHSTVMKESRGMNGASGKEVPGNPAGFDANYPKDDKSYVLEIDFKNSNEETFWNAVEKYPGWVQGNYALWGNDCHDKVADALTFAEEKTGAVVKNKKYIPQGRLDWNEKAKEVFGNTRIAKQANKIIDSVTDKIIKGVQKIEGIKK